MHEFTKMLGTPAREKENSENQSLVTVTDSSNATSQATLLALAEIGSLGSPEAAVRRPIQLASKIEKVKKKETAHPMRRKLKPETRIPVDAYVSGSKEDFGKIR